MFNFFIYTFCNLWCGDRARDGDIGYNFNDEIPQPTDDNQSTDKKINRLRALLIACISLSCVFVVVVVLSHRHCTWCNLLKSENAP